MLSCKGRPARYALSLKFKAGNDMFLLLAIILVLLWGGGFFLFHVSGFLIHLLIIFAVISLVIHLLTGRKA